MTAESWLMPMTLEQEVRILSAVPLFAQMEPEALRLLAFTAETISLANGDILYRAGEISDSGYVLMQGSMSLTSGVGGGMAELIDAPALLGQAALIVETRRPGDATASAPSTLLKIPRHLFVRVMREFPGGAAKLRAFLGSRLMDFVAELKHAREIAESRAEKR